MPKPYKQFQYMLKPFAIDGDKMQTIFNHFNLIKLYTCKGMKDLDCNSAHYHWLNNVHPM